MQLTHLSAQEEAFDVDDPQELEVQGESENGEATGEDIADGEETNSKKERPNSFDIDKLTPRELRNFERMLRNEEHVLYRGKTPFVRDWGFRSGVVELNVPHYEGWVNLTPQTDLYLEFAQLGVADQTLSGVYVNSRYMLETRANYINFYVLVWVPEGTAFKLFTEHSFAPVKEKLQADLVAVRQKTTNREDFSSFDDYFNFKFGKDEELEDFVDGRMIKAMEDDDFVSYFFTSEFRIQDEKSPLTEPMLGTTTIGFVRGKLVRFDVGMAYRSDEDVSRILEFTRQYFDDFKRVNSTDKR